MLLNFAETTLTPGLGNPLMITYGGAPVAGGYGGAPVGYGGAPGPIVPPGAYSGVNGFNSF